MFLLQFACNPRITCSVLSNVQLGDPSCVQSSCNRANVQSCNHTIVQSCKCAIAQSWCSRLLLCKRATFCPTKLSACGYNSQLRGENEHLARRQELVRMARSPPVDHDCQNCLKIARVPLRWWRHEAILPPSKTCDCWWGLVVGGSLVVWWGN